MRGNLLMSKRLCWMLYLIPTVSMKVVDYLSNPEHYKHVTLPYGRDLSDLKLKKDLSNILKILLIGQKNLHHLGQPKAMKLSIVLLRAKLQN